MPEPQNLVQLKVRGLFGRFDYDLPITRTDSPIAILTAPNGYGKTHLLHMVDALARQDYLELSRYTFDSLEIQLADQSRMAVTRTNMEESSGICRMDLKERSLGTEQEQRASVAAHPQWGARWESEEADLAATEWPERRKEFRNPTDPVLTCLTGCRLGISDYSGSACCLRCVCQSSQVYGLKWVECSKDRRIEAGYRSGADSAFHSTGFEGLRPDRSRT